MDAERRRELKRLGKAEVERRSAELRTVLEEANPANSGFGDWAQGYKLGTQRERWLRRKLPTLHNEELNELFVVRSIGAAGWAPHSGGYVQCMDCGSALPSVRRRSWLLFTGCRCGNIVWREFFWWRKVEVSRPNRVMPVQLIGRGQQVHRAVGQNPGELRSAFSSGDNAQEEIVVGCQISGSLVTRGMGGDTMADQAIPSEMSDEFRSMVLNLDPGDVGITRENFPYPVFALVMETGFPEGFFTLASVAEGTTSLYLSTGGGIIGGGDHESVRKASDHLLSGAQHFYRRGKKVVEFPKPKAGHVTFYFITFEGVLSYSAIEDDLGNEKDELSALFFAAHNVITELRRIEEGMYDS